MRTRITAATLILVTTILNGCESMDARSELSRDEAMTAYQNERRKRWIFQQTGTNTPTQQEAPLHGDEYKLALDRLRGLRKRLDATEDLKEASLILDEMSRTILEARRVLWERGEAKPKKEYGPRLKSERRD